MGLLQGGRLLLAELQGLVTPSQRVVVAVQAGGGEAGCQSGWRAGLWLNTGSFFFIAKPKISEFQPQLCEKLCAVRQLKNQLVIIHTYMCVYTRTHTHKRKCTNVNVIIHIRIYTFIHIRMIKT